MLTKTYSTDNKKILPWHTVEKKIQEEMDWLRNSLKTFLNYKDSNVLIKCKECLLRKIAIMIVRGEILATEYRKKSPLKSFWIANKVNTQKEIYHGKEWHSKIIKQLENHFIYQGYKIIRQPDLNWGRSDLGAFKKGEQPIYIEVGSTSIFKIWINLKTLGNFTYLIVPSNEKLVEFRKNLKNWSYFPTSQKSYPQVR